MDKYAVAVCNAYNSTNTIEIVEAEDEIKAIILAVEEEMIDLGIDNVEELLQYYHDGDIIVSRAVKIEDK